MQNQPLGKFGKVVRTVLFLQVLLFLFKGVTYWFGFPGIPGVSGGYAAMRRVAVLDWGFAVLLFFAARRLEKDARWIHPVLAMVLFNWLESAYEIFIVGDHAFIPPFVFESSLAALYTAYEIFLTRIRRT